LASDDGLPLTVPPGKAPIVTASRHLRRRDASRLVTGVEVSNHEPMIETHEIFQERTRIKAKTVNRLVMIFLANHL
jgi:hypothetical protein